ncbi:MAG: 2OG-Fe(II) oxygenase, partial [Acinetobacter sp.]|nr:2OG-Fe(II) oxygenase [Acinetobacter sp.]
MLDPVTWLNTDVLHQVFDDLEQNGIAWIDQIYPDELLTAIRQECLQHHQLFRQAEIQNGRLSDIRSDHILWIDEKLPLAQRHLQYLLHFAQQLNYAFYFGIHEVEAHFAHYHAGEFYKLHRDNPQGKNGRVISTVFYLHEHWQDG